MTTLTPVIVICLTLCAEGRDQGEAGMRRIASVIWCSAETHTGVDMAAECLQRNRYSCWNKTQPSVALMHQFTSNTADAQMYGIAMRIAREMVRNKFAPVIEATHYARTDCQKAWMSRMRIVETFRDHVFYRVQVS